MIHIKDYNSFVYGKYSSGKKNSVRKILNISATTQYEYDSKNKYIYSLKNNIFHEFVLLKEVKKIAIQNIIKHYITLNENKKYNTKQTYLIFYNIQFLKPLNLIKVLIEKTNYTFIFTCNTYNQYLSQFCIPIQHKEEIHKQLEEMSFDNELLMKCDNIITNVYNKNLKNVRTDLYSLFLNCFNITEIITQLMECAIKQDPTHFHTIISNAAKCEHESLHGNKNIFYLENFLLLLIKNEQ